MSGSLMGHRVLHWFESSISKGEQTVYPKNMNILPDIGLLQTKIETETESGFCVRKNVKVRSLPSSTCIRVRVLHDLSIRMHLEEVPELVDGQKPKTNLRLFSKLSIRVFDCSQVLRAKLGNASAIFARLSRHTTQRRLFPKSRLFVSHARRWSNSRTPDVKMTQGLNGNMQSCN